MSAKRIGKSGVIQAAGGLLWRRSGRGREIAVVYRSRYGDLALPKGWREKGETFIDAAVREVVEETNCQIEIGDFAGCICYTVEGVPKIVLFWNMVLTGDCDFKPDKEVDKLVWMTIPEALTKLTYEGERSLLASVAGVKNESDDE